MGPSVLRDLSCGQGHGMRCSVGFSSTVSVGRVRKSLAGVRAGENAGLVLPPASPRRTQRNWQSSPQPPLPWLCWCPRAAISSPAITATSSLEYSPARRPCHPRAELQHPPRPRPAAFLHPGQPSASSPPSSASALGRVSLSACVQGPLPWLTLIG